jgi:putative flippase GtrA
MIDLDLLADRFPRVFAMLKKRVVLLRKAMIFATIGLFNTFLDAAVFFAAYAVLASFAPPQRAIHALVELCRCGTDTSLTLIAANVTSWTIAVTSSYVLNSSITFAAESGRQLRWRAYLTFVSSGVLGLVANTTTLVIAAKFVPIWAAKGCAIMASFCVNFSMSHFVVFRVRHPARGRG